jgi:SAM-dependent methyltransferase
MPGLAPIVTGDLGKLPGIEVTAAGSDGRADVVLVEAARGGRDAVLATPVAEDVFVEVGRTSRAQGDTAKGIADRLWRPEQVQRALSIWAGHVRPLTASMTFRVIARVLQERAFLRTELRRQLDRAVQADRPRWRPGDPAQLEVWVSEYRPGSFVAGLRLSDVSMRQHRGRASERPGALRPTVAAAMVALAGEPGGLLLDPCCGSGTILAEARDAGWEVAGLDIDPDAVRVARENVPGASVEVGDARRLGLADGAAGAYVSNLPFGRQYGVQGEMSAWLERVMGEAARVTRPGGRVVVLAPQVPRAAVPAGLRLDQRHQLRLLGARTVLWAYDRA